jgi:hypothetical protein
MLRLCCCWIEAGRQLKRLIRVSGLVAGVGLVISLVPSANAQNLVVNGTFERSLDGWDIITIPEIGRFKWDIWGSPYGSARGDRVSSGPGSALYSRILGQHISTTIGDEYAITFQLFNQGISNLNVYFGANSFNVASSPFPGWETYSFGGTADSSDTLLAFVYADLYQSISIDNVSVHAIAKADVPSPLPLLGLGGAYGFSRKLRKRINLSKPAKGLSRVG